MSECEHGKCEGYCPQCGDLRTLAGRASHGPYTVDLGDDGHEIHSPSERLPYDCDDALFMAACTPERIIGLLDEVESLRRTNKQAIAENDAMKIRRGFSGVGPLVVVTCPASCGASMTLPFDQHSWTCLCGAEVSTPNGAGQWLIDQAHATIAARDETIATLRRLCVGESDAFLDGMGTMAVATGGELEEARRAWAKANAECCELKAEMARALDALAPLVGRRETLAEAITQITAWTIAGDELTLRQRTDLTEANRRTAAALEFAEKWGEGHAGWVAILRGEDG